MKIRILRKPALTLMFSLTGAISLQAQTNEDSLMVGLNGWTVSPKFTVTDVISGHRPPGKLDGIGAKRVGDELHVYVGHEIEQSMGSIYSLENGLQLKGARITKFTIDVNTKNITSAGIAYQRIYDRTGALVTSATQINEGTSTTSGLDKLCSASLFQAGTYNLVDDIFITGEETDNGQAFVLDVAGQDLYCTPWLGRAKFENMAFLQHPDPSKVACLIGDDTQSAPLYLYIGDKDYFGNNGFLDRNGLAHGTLYVFVAANGYTSPQHVNGTNTRFTGSFQMITHYQPQFAGTSGYDAMGFAHQVTQYQKGNGINNFHFSRPEDVATDPYNGTRAVYASTGRGSLYPADDIGTTYIVDVNFSDLSVKMHILYDGDDAGGGQFPHADHGLRNPDNLDWGNDGSIYIQEDLATEIFPFGSVSGEEVSVWELDPITGSATRIAQVDRTATFPTGTFDNATSTFAAWETSGVLDVTKLFDVHDRVILLATVQAHSLTGGPILQHNLVEGGQLCFIEGPVQTNLIVRAKGVLDGPYDAITGLMRDDLRIDSLIPDTQPYTIAPFLYSGTETIHPGVLSISGNNAIVDWVMMELRTSAAPGSVLKRLVGLLQRDGDIVDMDGLSPIRFRSTVSGDYHVTLKHRTHLGVMTQSVQPLRPVAMPIDFSSPSLATWGISAQKVYSGVRSLWAGDANGDGLIKYTGNNNDRDPILIAVGGISPTAIAIGYSTLDVDLNGIIRYTGTENDRDRILQSIGGVIPTMVRTQQVP
jgi:hypothetical protein